MNKTGYAKLNNQQLKILYGPKSPYNCSKALNNLINLNYDETQRRLLSDVNKTALMKNFKIRLKKEAKAVVLEPISYFTIVC